MTYGLMVVGLVWIGLGVDVCGAQVGPRGQGPELVNLGRLPIARVFSSGPNSSYVEGVRILFDGKSSVNQAIYSSWTSVGTWVVVRFSRPVTVHRVVVEAVATPKRASRSGSFTVTLRTGDREIDSPSLRLPVTRTSYTLPRARQGVREVLLSFRSKDEGRAPPMPAELAEIEIMGPLPPGVEATAVTPPVDPDALRELTAGHADRAAKLTWKRTELDAIRQAARPKVGQMRTLRTAIDGTTDPRVQARNWMRMSAAAVSLEEILGDKKALEPLAKEATSLGVGVEWCEPGGSWAARSEGYEKYLTLWPDGPEADEAWWKGRVEGWCGDYEGTAEEDRDMIATYAAFLKAFPKSGRAAEARKTMNELQQGLDEKLKLEREHPQR
jgi:hypothetical protein